MTTQLHALLGPVIAYDRLRSARNHRNTRVHTYAIPVVRELPPKRPDALDASRW